MDRIIACYNYCYLTLGVQCFFILFFLNVLWYKILTLDISLKLTGKMTDYVWNNIHSLGTNKISLFSISFILYIFIFFTYCYWKQKYFICRILVDLKKEVWYQKCHDPVCKEKNFRSQSMYLVFKAIILNTFLNLNFN